jgi:hypothetical protein
VWAKRKKPTTGWQMDEYRSAKGIYLPLQSAFLKTGEINYLSMHGEIKS